MAQNTPNNNSGYSNYQLNKRVDNTDREVACLLSGGLDSSLITALVARKMDNPKI